MSYSEEELAICLRVLQAVADDPTQIQEHKRFKALVAKIHREGKRGERRSMREARQASDLERLAATQIVRQQVSQVPAQLIDQPPSDQPELQQARRCYICKQPFTRLHHFYHQLCPACAPLNYAKRSQRADLRGRLALVTGGRIKIGYQMVLRLLRDGARVMMTTRFPLDAASRFALEADFAEWQDRLQIVALDLRHLPKLEQFCDQLSEQLDSLDIVINNAAQTVKRPRAFYQHLLDQRLDDLPEPARQLLPADLSASPDLLEAPVNGSELIQLDRYFPLNSFDSDGQQLDLRPDNSWMLRLDQVSTVELLEVHLVNAVAPAMLLARLKPLLLRSPFARRFVINVSAMEGQFGRASKTIYHPHTNMAKAALNMLTRTSAADYARDSIYMNSVDTGWITDEKPFPAREQVRVEQHFFTPLDYIDAVARLYDPIVQGIDAASEPIYGHFLKDYQIYPW
jgi:NAD(P)-dependent dehydrogenase (short-subunit alcohol dehydrogenase family)